VRLTYRLAVKIPLNRPQLASVENAYIDAALASGKLPGNGEFARRWGKWLEDRLGPVRALITASCTLALGMTGMLAGLELGDEVIVPGFALVSTADAFAVVAG
jgi:dTDP-4-amino-4,6-dideoxygalactose transaminase